MPKKVLYVITKSNWGGAQRYVFDLATHLPKSEFEGLVALGGDGLLKKKLEAEHVRTYSLTSMERDISFFKEISSFFALYRIFKKEQPDIVHLNSSKAGGLGSVAARLAGVRKIIFTVHGWPFLEKRNIVVRALIWLFSWMTALFAHKVIVISDYDLSIAQHMPFATHKVVRIYNGIDTAAPLGDGKVIRDAFPAGVQITGTIGELNKNKNQQALVEEAKNKPDLYVAIVGEGEERQALEQKIKDYNLESRVKLFGFMPAQEALRGFDTFALPSLKEGLPYVLLEAKAAGLPIVANRVGGVGEILDTEMSNFILEEMVRKTVRVYSMPL